MSRKIIIHAGWPKTGTSSVQNALFDSREALLAEGNILYPSIANFQSRMLVTMFRENPADQAMNKVQGVSDAASLSQLASNYKEAYESEIQASNWDTLILSAEGLANFSRDELKKFKDWIDGFSQDQTIYLLVREPAKFTGSAIQQFLKTGHVLETMYTNLPRSIMPDYKEKILNFIAVFGDNNVKVDSFENVVKHAAGLMGYFVEKWNIGENMGAKLVAEARHDNSSLTMLSAQILSSINRQRPMFHKGEKGANRTLAELNFLKTYDQGQKFKLPRDVVSRIHEIVAHDMIWLERKYGIEYSSSETQIDDESQSLVRPTKDQQAFIDSAALMISDLLNERHFLRMKARANRLRNTGEQEEAEVIMTTARRIFPHNP